jgi:protein-disulfide isomerase
VAVTKLRGALETITYLAVIVASCSVLWWVAVNAKSHGAAQEATPLPTVPLPLDGAAVLGARNAPVGVIVFSDFECPFCSKMAREVLPSIRQKFVEQGLAILAFRHFPLAIHAHAVEAAEVAECAKAQGHFWQMHDVLFGADWLKEEPSVNWERLAQVAGVRVDAFAGCRAAGGQKKAIDDDVAHGRRIDVRGTPTLFIGRHSGDSVTVTNVITGVRPVTEVEAAITDLLGNSADDRAAVGAAN